MECKKCGAEVNGVFCSNCGMPVNDEAITPTEVKPKKAKKPIYKKWWFWLIIVLVFIFIVAVNSGDDDSNSENAGAAVSDEAEYEADTHTTTKKKIITTAESEETYKESCLFYTYNDIARNPDSVKGERAKIVGKVFQVQEKGSEVILMVNITQGEYGSWNDSIMVYYEIPDGESRILEDDVVSMCGKLGGTYTYTTVMGAERTVPLLYAEYVDVEYNDVY